MIGSDPVKPANSDNHDFQHNLAFTIEPNPLNADPTVQRTLQATHLQFLSITRVSQVSLAPQVSVDASGVIRSNPTGRQSQAEELAVRPHPLAPCHYCRQPQTQKTITALPRSLVFCASE